MPREERPEYGVNRGKIIIWRGAKQWENAVILLGFEGPLAFVVMNVI